jgi:HPt (histidine-containing phosphotransfer) domain-containing protein
MALGGDVGMRPKLMSVYWCFRKAKRPDGDRRQRRDARESEAMSPADVDALVDREGLMERVDHDGALLKELVVVHESDSRRLLNAIAEAIGLEDAERLRTEAHSFKGAIGSMGGRAAYGSAVALEAAAKKGDLAEAKTHLERLRSDVEDLKRALRALAEASEA